MLHLVDFFAIPCTGYIPLHHQASVHNSNIKSWIPVQLGSNALLTAYQFQIQLHQLSFKHIKVLEQVSHKDISTEKFLMSEH